MQTQIFETLKTQIFETLKTHDNVIIKVSATWCSPCNNKTFIQNYKNLKYKYEKNGITKFFELDADNDEEIINNLNIDVSSVPSFFVYNKNVLINTYEGTQCLNKIETYFIHEK